MSELKLGQDRAYLDKKAHQEGLVVFLPEPDEIFLDLDYGAQINDKVMEYIIQTLMMGMKPYLFTTSKSGNRHAYIKFTRELSYFEKVIFQVCLGSDPVKELFSFMQLKQIKGVMELELCECPIALFETKAEALRVYQWRADNATSTTLRK